MIAEYICLLMLSCSFLANQIKDTIKHYFSSDYKGIYIYNKDAFIWTETFGKQTDPCILLIHGAGSCRKFWPDAFCKKLAEKNFFIIRYDQRDSGYSKRYKAMKKGSLYYSFNDLVDDACTILNHYNIQKTHVIGHSMGGCIAAGLIAFYETRLLTSTLIGSGYVFNHQEQKLFNLSEKNKNVIDQLRAYKPIGWYAYDRTHLLKKTKIVHGSYIINEELFDDYMQEFYKLFQQKPAIKNHILVLESRPENLLTLLKKSFTKTLIMHGTDDNIIPYDWAKTLSKQMTNATIISVVGAGHLYFNQDLWDLFEREILNFILAQNRCH